jgi:hypothetical protein
VSRRDTAARLLTAAVRLLPPARQDWGAAMLAELGSIESRRDRSRFSAGCVRVVVTRPAVWRRAAYVLSPVALVVYVVQWSAWLGWAPRRWGVVAFAAALAVVAELGLIGPLGPVGRSSAARFARAVGYLLVGALAVEAALFMAHQTNNDLDGMPVLSIMFAGYLAGALAMTAHRSAATSRTLVAGLTGGLAAAGAWTALAVLDPPIPPDAGLAVVLVALGMAGTGMVVQRHGGPEAGWRAALTAGTTSTLMILNVVTVLSAFGPAELIPHMMPPALDPADQIANSRIEVTDPYLWLLLLGWFVALAQWGASRSGARSTAETLEGAATAPASSA